MSKGKFDPIGEIMGPLRTAAKSWEWGSKLGSNIAAKRLQRQLEDEGYDPITIEAAVEAVKAERSPEPILAQANRAYAAIKKQNELKLNPPPIHGSARWATLEELDQQKLFHPLDGRSLALGTSHNKPLNWDGEGHLLSVAPTRTGKGTMQIIPNLLNYKGSVVVLDPKGELFQHTAAWRAKIVGPVYAINPFGEAGIPKTAAFNPLDNVTDSQSALELAEILYPRTHDDKQQFFENEAVAFLTAVIEFVACFAPKDHRTLGTIRDTLSTLDKGLYGLVKAMADDTMPPSIRNAARNFMTKSRETGQPRVLDSLNTHLRIWDTVGLRESTKQTDFRFEDLKDRPITIYLVLPFEKIEAYTTFVRMLFATALDAMLTNKTKPDIPVLFIFDEFLSLNRDDRFISALRTHAGAGVRLWFFLQDLPTLEQKYPTTWKSFLQVETKTFFGTDDPYTAELISRYLGDQTVAYESPNLSSATTGGASASASYSISENIQLTGRKLLTTDEVLAFMSGSAQERPAVHFLRDMRPVQAQLKPWFLDKELLECCDGKSRS